MKRRIGLLVVTLIMLLALCSCGNRSMFDTTYTFKTAIIELPNGTIVEGKVDSWRDFDDGDSIQVTINGTTYLTHISKVCLMTGD